MKEIRLCKNPGVLSYLWKGARINTQLAVDFAADELNLQGDDALSKVQEHNYEAPITAIVSQLEQLNNCGRVPTYAFGGGLPYTTKLAECLALSGDVFQPELNGTEEVSWIVGHSQKMGCYTKGPRNLAPILRRVNNYGEYLLDNRPGDYEVLVVILDGTINDWREEAAE